MAVSAAQKKQIRTALKAFSISAWVTGMCLLALTARMIAQYLLHLEIPSWASPIAIVHGWAYAIFFVCCLVLGVQARWTPARWLTTVLAGVVPFLSFIVEHNRRQEVVERFQLNRLD